MSYQRPVYSSHTMAQAAISAAFAVAYPHGATPEQLSNFEDGFSSAMNAYVGGPSRGDAWTIGRRAGLAYYSAVSRYGKVETV